MCVTCEYVCTKFNVPCSVHLYVYCTGKTENSSSCNVIPLCYVPFTFQLKWFFVCATIWCVLHEHARGIIYRHFCKCIYSDHNLPHISIENFLELSVLVAATLIQQIVAFQRKLQIQSSFFSAKLSTAKSTSGRLIWTTK